MLEILALITTLHTNATAPCASDEWQTLPGQACVWDARHMGDGLGRSFKVRADGNVYYITHKRAHRLLYGG